MTALAPAPQSPTTPEAPRQRRWFTALTSWPAVVGAAAVGILVVGLSYQLATEGGNPNVRYGVFWLGMLLAMLPVTARVATGDRVSGYWGVALIGVLTYVPKFLRNPFAPAYHDEYAHYREAVDVLASGQLFRPNSLIPIVTYYPGTSGITAWVSALTGLPVWASGQLVLFTAHMIALFGIVVLARVHLRSAAAGALAAVVYALNPSEMYFDTQYSYEGIAIALFLWVLVFASLGARATGRRRAVMTGLALLCSAACVVTHHLTTLFLVLLLLVVVAVVAFRRWRSRTAEGAGVWWVVFGGTVALFGAWVATVAVPTVAYLSPYFGGSLAQLSTVGSEESRSRVVLAESPQPFWERGLTAAAPVLVALVCLAAFLVLRKRLSQWRADTLTLMAFGFVYFPSVLFLLAPSGAEGARRSWAFSYLGIALLAAFVVLRWRAAPRVRWFARGWALTLAFTVVLVGNVGAGLNDPYRFPGPFRWGTDTNSASAEARTVARALSERAGAVRVVADRYTALQLVAYGGLTVAAPSEGFPAWELVQTATGPSPRLAADLRASGFDYLVVDTRMAEQPSFIGDNFGPTDPLIGQATPKANLDRLDAVPWATRVITTEHLRVYHLDFFLLEASMAGTP
ncbi:hypothetical protein [Actinokineospora bangkokensis]|uniref:Glycosyltransferase RgtA/B/C/D-like domain-containing protein n=1 Tax=Actinokineospora bangkokensis TaxID=1193682 RepID=A0A1Q9LKB6_9PSEU|nr:hypothetical protein [Actinokineospora bangkokensis]OLR92443.1 hypothetical protein BJP25_20395 [Actinokineospora bangkokensis]